MGPSFQKGLRILNLLNSNSTDSNVKALSKGDTNSKGKASYSLEVKFNMAKDSNCSCDKYSTSTPTTSSDSLVDIDTQRQIYEEESIIRQKLSIRSYHLPGNTWGQDYAMYIKNNHLVFGLCCRHRLNPVTTKHRLIILLGSLACGLTITNAVYLYFLLGDKNYDDTALAFTLSLSGEAANGLNTSQNLSLDISNGMAMLWTLGAGAHAMFDLLLWHMIACGYCQTSKRNYNHAGWNMALAVVSIIVAGASFVVLYRAYEDDENDPEEQLLKFADDGNQTVVLGEDSSPHRPITIETIKAFRQSDPDFRFLYGYLVELGLSLFVFTPIIQTILFSGIFGCCGRLPLVGGRPRSVMLENEKMKHCRKELPV